MRSILAMGCYPAFGRDLLRFGIPQCIEQVNEL